MSSISSLEVFRPVLLPKNSLFMEKITSISRNIYDVDGDEFIAIRPSNETNRTTKSGIQVLSEHELKYCHHTIADLNVKRFGKKLINLRDRLEDGPEQEFILGNESSEERAGNEPLADTLNHSLLYEYNYSPDEYIPAVISGVEVVEDHMLHPGELIFGFLLSGIEKSAESMFKRMSYLTRLAVKNSTKNERLLSSTIESAADIVPFARTRIDDLVLRKNLLETVNELTPTEVQLKVEVGPLEFSTTY